MKVRTVYFKVENPAQSAAFWSEMLGAAPQTTTDVWYDIHCGDVRLGFVLNDMDENYHGSGCVPVFEVFEDQLKAYTDKAVSLGATLVADARENPVLQSVVLRAPDGHEFELTKRHDPGV